LSSMCKKYPNISHLYKCVATNVAFYMNRPLIRVKGDF
jgi:hypothetical protein